MMKETSKSNEMKQKAEIRFGDSFQETVMYSII